MTKEQFLKSATELANQTTDYRGRIAQDLLQQIYAMEDGIVPSAATIAAEPLPTGTTGLWSLSTATENGTWIASLIAQGAFTAALAESKKLSPIDGDRAKFWIAKAMMQKGRTGEAIEIADTILSPGAKIGAYHQLGAQSLLAEDRATATDLFRKAANIFDDKAHANDGGPKAQFLRTTAEILPMVTVAQYAVGDIEAARATGIKTLGLLRFKPTPYL